MTALFLGRGFADFRSLRDLEAGRRPSIEDLRRRLFVEERRSDTGRPDHFYKAYLQQRLGAARGLSCLAPIILNGMADRFLHRRGDRLFVKNTKLFEWQSATPSMSPLAVAATALAGEDLNLLLDEAPIRHMALRLGGSAIIGPHLTALDELIDREGLVDIHIHLNGSTEVDRVWADAVMKPLPYLRELHGVFSKQGARELYDQVEADLTPALLYGRLRAARRVRHVVASEIRRVLDGGAPRCPQNEFIALFDPKREDHDPLFTIDRPLGRSPYFDLFPATRETAAPLHAEGAFLAVCLQAFERLPVLRDYIGLMLWHSLTVFTQVARLSVQQPDQTGFHQFDKFNAVGARDQIERAYEQRLHQLNGPGRGRLSYLDARFAPKKTTYGTEALLGRVVQGLARFRGCSAVNAAHPLRGPAPPCLTGDCACPQRRDRLDLALVAHFIKSPQRAADAEEAGGPDASCRHAALRQRLEVQARALCRSIRRSKVLQALVRGVDGAGNELDAPPEVFAPTFRRVRAVLSSGGATFHAGEDFLHLLSGIRAVDEAVTFLDLKDGDRVGHAVALGVAPDVWAARVDDRILMPVEDVLDNAVHALSALARSRRRFGDEALLTGWVEQYSKEIYDRVIGVSTLKDAWSLRHLDVMALRRLQLRFQGDMSNVDALCDYLDHAHRTALDSTLRAEIAPIRKAALEAPAALSLFIERHAWATRRRGARIVEVPVAPRNPGAVSMETLTYLQEDGLRRLGERGVVIETLPSSNVRIGGYRDASEHHLLRWLGVVPGLDVRPRLAVGSDDPGIFSTNIAGEFAHIHAALEAHDAEDVMRHLRRLNRTGREVRFRSPLPDGSGQVSRSSRAEDFEPTPGGRDAQPDNAGLNTPRGR